MSGKRHLLEYLFIAKQSQTLGRFTPVKNKLPRMQAISRTCVPSDAGNIASAIGSSATCVASLVHAISKGPSPARNAADTMYFLVASIVHDLHASHTFTS
jgi:hypothetical protein